MKPKFILSIKFWTVRISFVQLLLVMNLDLGNGLLVATTGQGFQDKSLYHKSLSVSFEAE